MKRFTLTVPQKSAEGKVGHAVGEAIEALGAADKAANLERWKSFLCQLPVFGRIAYPVRAEVTKHDMPGCKSLGCPAEYSQRWERPGRGAVDNTANLARCKSLRRQLPVFGRLAYPVRAEATMHVLPGRKSLGRPTA